MRGRDTHEDDRFDANPKAKTYESEFMGGEHDLEEQEVAAAEEDFGTEHSGPSRERNVERCQRYSETRRGDRSRQKARATSRL